MTAGRRHIMGGAALGAGQAAEIKLETFPFTRYRTLPATVLHVSPSSVRPQELAKDAPADTAAPPSGPIYAIKLKLARDTIRTEGGDTRLTPGLALAVEIKTGHRRIIDYVLAPLLRYRMRAGGKDEGCEV